MSRLMHLTDHLVSRAFRSVPEPDESELDGWTRLDDTAIAAEADTILAERPPGPLYVFAYGSLLWKPEFEPAATLRGAVHGWHRAFCIELTSWRGTPDAPGLMMALLPGGHCTGLALQVPETRLRASVEALVRRETPYDRLLGSRTWLTVETARAPLSALTFYAPPAGERLRTDLPPATTARLIARACGHAGSNVEYLHETMKSLGAHGIRDGQLWRLQKLVAAELERLP